MLELNLNESILYEITTESSKDIAIIGIDVRLPMADNIDEFWENLIHKKDCLGDFPYSRKRDVEKYLRYRDQTVRKVHYANGGYLKEIDKFDNDFFKISNKEASLMDPHQRIFLESAWKAIEDSGYGCNKLVGSNTGVYVGFTPRGEYRRFIGEVEPDSLALSEAGNLSSIVASRISYILDLRGPSMIVNTECSSSLVAVHLACRSLRNGECDLAIAGGVRLSFSPIVTDQKLGIESHLGKVCTFDDDSDGAVFGEGSVALILKPLHKAVNDRDHIYAVIKGSAVNQDGASVGITAPNLLAQEDVIVDAWKDANVSPESVTYIEAHGTGTKLGDPIEVNAINRAFQRYTDKKQLCGIGSVKTNIAHLDNVAGIASLVKVVLALKNKKIPPTIHFNKPNRQINFENSAVYINDRLRDWDIEEWPRRAGVSSFGLSGTNCHVILEEAPQKCVHQTNRFFNGIFTVSATKKEVCISIVRAMRDYLRSNSEMDIGDICYTSNTGRGHYNYRIAIITDSSENLLRTLEKICNQGIEHIQDSNIWFGEHYVTSNNKSDLSPNEIYEHQRKELSKEANQYIYEYIQNSGLQLNDKMANMCKLYIQGADLDWEKLFHTGDYNRVSLPTYLFEAKRCWLSIPERSKTRNTSEIQVKGESYDHPLLDQLAIKSMSQDIYLTNFNVSKHWVLKEHNIMGKYLLPGTAYLEMLTELGFVYFKGVVEFRNVIFLNSLVVDESETKEIQTIITKNKDYLMFTIAGKSEVKSGEDWIVYCQGELHEMQSGKFENKFDIHAYRSTCTQEITIQKTRDGLEDGKAFNFGPRWTDVTKAIYVGEEEVFAELELPRVFSGDLEEYFLHPSMLDMAVNVITQSTGNGIFLPFSYESFKVFGPIECCLYSYVKRMSTSKNLETMSFNIELFNGREERIAEITNLTVKRVNQKATDVQKAPCYFIDYEMDAYNNRKPFYTKESVLVFCDQSRSSKGILNGLMDSGRRVIQVSIGKSYERVKEDVYTIRNLQEDYDRIFEELKVVHIGQIAHLLSASYSEENNHIEGLNNAIDMSVLSIFKISKSIINLQISDNIDLIALVDKVNLVTSEQTTVNAHFAPLFGMCKVINKEFSNLKCRVLDIDEFSDKATIVAEINAEYDNFYIAIRNNKKFLEVFKETQINEKNDFKSIIKENGTYVLTGGTGGLGIQFAKVLSKTKKVNIVLIGRKEWKEVVFDSIGFEEIRKFGTTVSYYSGDVADIHEMSKILKEVRQIYGRINGIIHMAGVAGNGYIVNKTLENFKEVLSPKVNGTLLLYRLTESDNLDFFVNFSSISSVIGYAGQSDYVAANSYLDSLSGYGKLKNQKVKTINWAPWKEYGMAVDYGLKDNGIFKMLSTHEAIDAFKRVMCSDEHNVIIGNLNIDSIVTAIDQIPFKLSEEISSMLESRTASGGRQPSQYKENVSVAIKGRAKANYSKSEAVLAKIWGRVLGTTNVDVYANFMEIGGDSILAVELLKEIEKEYPSLVSVSDVFSYSSIAEMAKFIDDKISPENKTKDKLAVKGKVMKLNNILDILDQLEKGSISINDAEEILK
ncbi:SDR family NAD(P)-dependent oxidoreductase [Paenibacillus sp. LMG 31461]|uniref:SDR family NAD(P)-dependent oxidoreductase n=1 Tax=Paenibacillus plantarum TaxID=2654975 RepID=A0ABX1X7F2_9BACL|nr:type I polyketide synthase [Paenibacillus plantarum]NOU64363.1 SDR family NAD(P)-dependent oxidoreductase [Paenibacillus plantarum]